MVISIRKYLYGSGAATAGPGQGAGPGGVALAEDLLQAIEKHVLAEGRWAGLRREVEQVRESLRGALAPARLAEIAGRAEAVLENYHAAAKRHAAAQASELHKILAMLNETLVVLSTGSERSVSRLRQIEKKLDRVNQIDDIVALKSNLAECLNFVREESAREREEAAHTLAGMEQDVRRARDALVFAANGMGKRAEASAALSEAGRDSRRAASCFVAVFVVERFGSVALRYGEQVAEELLLAFARDRLQALAGCGPLFRWAREAVLILIERGTTLAEVRLEVDQAMTPFDHRIYVGDRAAILTLVHRRLVCPLEGASAKRLIEEIDSFVGLQAEPKE